MTSDPPLLALVHGGTAGQPVVNAVEALAGATHGDVPILVMAESLSEAEEDRLFAAGARDVLTIPVAPTRLRVRILAMRRAVLRNAKAATTHVYGDLVIDTGRREASIGGEELCLTCSEFNLLVLLAREPRRVVTREVLATCIGQPGNGKAVESHLSRLRKKVSGASPTLAIEPVRGVGYRLGEMEPA
ncbi:MAG: response regulator transcription factor, partial [Ornithinimicrobium sp.]